MATHAERQVPPRGTGTTEREPLDAADIRAAYPDHRSNGSTISVRCPVHGADDSDHNCKFFVGRDGQYSVACHSHGCRPEEIFRATRERLANGSSPKRETTRPRSARSKATYATRDAAIRAVEWLTKATFVQAYEYIPDEFYNVRLEPKDFRPVTMVNGRWQISAPSVRPLYRRDAIRHGELVFVVEGEKDVHAMEALGLVAVTGGAARNVTNVDWRPLGGCDVVLVPDRDTAGEQWARELAALFTDANNDHAPRRVRVVSLPAKDAADWLETNDGKDSDDLRQALVSMAEAAQDVSAAAAGDAPDAADETQSSPKASGSERWTEAGNAMRLIKKYPGELLYCEPFGKWLIWDGRRFRIDDRREVEFFAKATISQMIDDALRMTDLDAAKKLLAHAMISEKAHGIRAMIDLARCEVPVLPDELDNDRMQLNVENGTLNLRDGTLTPHDKADRITKLAPVEYNPDAGCPKWLTFLDEIFNKDQALIGYVRRVIGYCLTGSTREQCFFIGWGGGSNGKSTFARVISEMMGDHSKQTPTDTLLAKRGDSIPNDVAALKGARFVTALESEDGRRLAEGLIKQLSGGDEVTARFMRAEFFSFLPAFKILLCTNHRPTVRGTDHALWRRVRLIPFNVTVPPERQNKNLVHELLHELPGILTWALGGCLKWQKVGLHEPEAVRLATANYRESEDDLGRFFDERCGLSDSLRASTKELADAYCEWSGTKMSTRRMIRLIEERGYELTGRSTGGRRYVRGIGLRVTQSD